MTERQVLLDAIFVCFIDEHRAAQPAAALGLFALEQVPFAGVGPHDFASAGDFKPFCHRLLRFDAFRTSHNLL
jgi:hypothetical protein